MPAGDGTTDRASRHRRQRGNGGERAQRGVHEAPAGDAHDDDAADALFQLSASPSMTVAASAAAGAPAPAPAAVGGSGGSYALEHRSVSSPSLDQFVQFGATPQLGSTGGIGDAGGGGGSGGGGGPTPALFTQVSTPSRWLALSNSLQQPQSQQQYAQWRGGMPSAGLSYSHMMQGAGVSPFVMSARGMTPVTGATPASRGPGGNDGVAAEGRGPAAYLDALVGGSAERDAEGAPSVPKKRGRPRGRPCGASANQSQPRSQQLPPSSPSDATEFLPAIHRQQQLVAPPLPPPLDSLKPSVHESADDGEQMRVRNVYIPVFVPHPAFFAHWMQTAEYGGNGGNDAVQSGQRSARRHGRDEQQQQLLAAAMATIERGRASASAAAGEPNKSDERSGRAPSPTVYRHQRIAFAPPAAPGGNGARKRIEEMRSARELNKKTREAAIVRFRQKKQERKFDKRIRYRSRKKLADNRPRVGGRFVKMTAEEEREWKRRVQADAERSPA